MHEYLFYGKVLPERAPISMNFSAQVIPLGEGAESTVTVNILLNQIAAWVKTEKQWDVLDLRNIVKTLVQNYLSMTGYLTGHAYDMEITRVICHQLGVDYVFGIDIPCVANRRVLPDIGAALNELNKKTDHEHGVFLNRCFTDLTFAMKHADDTAFYCYRAIESLKNHCAAVNGLAEKGRDEQWKKFREISTCNEATIRKIKIEADQLRHGGDPHGTGANNEMILSMTFSVVDSYIDNFQIPIPHQI